MTTIPGPAVIDVTPAGFRPVESRLLPRLAMLAVLLGGFALRMQRLGIPSLWLDELGQVTPAMRGLAAVIDAARRHHGAAPLDYLLSWLALHVAQQDFALRLPAALLGTLTLALVYLLARTALGELEAVLAALLLAVAPLHLRYSQEARFYALFTCIAVASTVAWAVALQRGRRRAWVAYTALLTAGLYSHYYMPLVAAAHGLATLAAWLLPRWFPLPRGQSPARALRGLLLSCAAAAIAFLPWLIFAVSQERRVQRGVAPEFSLELARQMAAGFVTADVQQTPAVEGWLPWLYVALLAAGIAAGLARRPSRTPMLALTALVLAGPLAIVLALRWVAYFFEMRQVLFLLPFALILVAAGVVAVAEGLGRLTGSPRWEARLRLGVTGFLALLLTGPLWPASRATPGMAREDWRGALRFVAASAAPDEVILVPGLSADRYLGYYTAEWPQQPLTPMNPDEAAAMTGDGRAAWIVTIPQTAAIAAPLAETAAVRLHFKPRVTVYYVDGSDESAAWLARAADWAGPDNAGAAQELAEALQAAGLNDAAERVLQEAASGAVDPRDASLVQTLLGSLRRREGDSARALAAYRQAAALWPGNAEARVRLGEGLLLAGDARAAAQELAAAVALAPDHFWAQRFLGQAYLQLDRPRQAAQQFETAARIDPAVADTYLLLGDARAAYRDWRGASEAYGRLLELAPDSPLAAQARARLNQLGQR